MKLLANKMVKGILVFFLAIAAVLSLVFGVQGLDAGRKVSAADGDSYTLVTDINDLSAGDQLLFVYKNTPALMGAISSTKTQYGLSVTEDVTMSDENTITAIGAAKVVTLGGTTNAWTFKTDEGYLYWSSGNSLQVKSDAEYAWTIAVATDGTATIASATTPARKLQYNSGFPRFACYTSSQAAIALYQLQAQGECSHTWVDGNVVAPTCTEQGYTEQTCSLCSESRQANFTEALGHDMKVTYTKEAPTCTKEGLGTQTCQRECGYFEENVTLPVIPHTYVNNVCTECGKVREMYAKVTATPADWSGKYLIVYEGETEGIVFNGNLTSNEMDSNGNSQKVTIENNTIFADATIENSYFNIQKIEGTETYSVQAQAGAYIEGKTADSNGINFPEEATGNTLTLNEDGTVHIVSNDKYLRYNNGTQGATTYDWFRFYKASTYKTQNAIALYKLVEGTESFVAHTTDVSFKLGYDETNTVNDAMLRFGMTISADFFDTLAANGTVTYGVVVSSGDVTVDYDMAAEGNEDWLPVKSTADGRVDENGTHYSFSAVIGGIAWDQEFTATVYVKINGEKFCMKEVTYSVSSLAQSYLESGLFDNNEVVTATLNILAGGGAN